MAPVLSKSSEPLPLAKAHESWSRRSSTTLDEFAYVNVLGSVSRPPSPSLYSSRPALSSDSVSGAAMSRQAMKGIAPASQKYSSKELRVIESRMYVSICTNSWSSVPSERCTRSICASDFIPMKSSVHEYGGDDGGNSGGGGDGGGGEGGGDGGGGEGFGDGGKGGGVWGGPVGGTGGAGGGGDGGACGGAGGGDGGGGDGGGGELSGGLEGGGGIGGGATRFSTTV